MHNGEEVRSVTAPGAGERFLVTYAKNDALRFARSGVCEVPRVRTADVLHVPPASSRESHNASSSEVTELESVTPAASRSRARCILLRQETVA